MMIKKIAVLGSGTMGHGIAESFAMYNYEVNLYDIDMGKLTAAKKQIEEELKIFVEEKMIAGESIPQILSRITLIPDLKKAVADRDFVIEAAPEVLELKQTLFKQLDELCPKHAILASNTSSLKLSDMMALVSKERQARMMVNHYYNPAHVMPIVEMSCFGNMPEELYKEVEALYASIKKQTIKVLKDVPGLVANRMQQGVAREAFYIIEQGIASPEDVDKALIFGPGFRYATTGQLEIADMGGLDIWYLGSDSLLKHVDNSRNANPLLKKKWEEGKLGLKSGEGFYKYSPEDAPVIKKKFIKRLIHQLKASEYYANEMKK